MKTTSLVLIALVMALTGCTHTRTIDLDASSFAEINRRYARKKATVTLTVEPYLKAVADRRMIVDQREILVRHL